MPSRADLIKARNDRIAAVRAARAANTAAGAAASPGPKGPTVGGVPVQQVSAVSMPTATSAAAGPARDHLTIVLSAVAQVSVPVFKKIPATVDEAKSSAVDDVTVETGHPYSLLSAQTFGAGDTLVFAPMIVVDGATGGIDQYYVPIGKNTELSPNASAEVVRTDFDFFFRDFTA